MPTTDPPTPPAPQADVIRRSLLSTGSVVMLVLNLGLVVGLAVALMVTRGRFMAIFDEMDVKLPSLSQFILDTPLWIHLLFLGLVAAMLIAKEYFVRRPLAKLIANTLTMLLLAALVLTLILALWLPLIALITSLT